MNLLDELRRELVRAVKFVDGAPDVTGLTCDVIAGADGEYMRRYHVTGPAVAQSSRFHHIVASDPQPDLHDHPWDFVSALLAGSYTEITPNGVRVWEAPCVIVRKAENLHRLILPDGPVWSYVVCGRVRRRWGFETSRGWVPWRSYADAGSTLPCGPGVPLRAGRSRW